MLFYVGSLSFFMVIYNVLATCNHIGMADKLQHEPSKDDLETIDRLVRESTELQTGMRNMELNLIEYRMEVGNITTELEMGYEQTLSSLRNAQARLRIKEIQEAQRRQRENFESAINRLQATVDEHRRNLREHRQRQIEEFNRVNRQILRARETLNEEGD